MAVPGFLALVGKWLSLAFVPGFLALVGKWLSLAFGPWLSPGFRPGFLALVGKWMSLAFGPWLSLPFVPGFCLAFLVDQTIGFIRGLPVAAFDGADEREIMQRPGTPKERRLSSIDYVLCYGPPQFFCHVTTCYALLRYNGVAIGKKTDMGSS